MQNDPPLPALVSGAAPRPAATPASILCGTDFSASAAQAVEFAATLARRLGEPLVLAHAVNAGPQENLPGELRDSLNRYARARLNDEFERLREMQVELVESLHTGAPEVVLLAEAEAHHARLLVLAAAQRRSCPCSLLAGVTERVAESAFAPTLIVRDAAPLLRWLREERRLRVLVGADFSAPSEAALSWVRWLQKVAPCEVVVVYLDPGVAPYPTGDQFPSLLLDDMLAKAAQMEQRHFRQRVKRMLGPVHVRVRFEKGWGRSDAHLIELASEEHADLMVVGTHSRRGWQRLGHHSVSRGVLHYAPLNVACVPSRLLDDPSLFH